MKNINETKKENEQAKKILADILEEYKELVKIKGEKAAKDFLQSLFSKK